MQFSIRMATTGAAIILAATLGLTPTGTTANGPADSAGRAYEKALLTPHQNQPLSYGGGLEWTLRPESDCRIYVREFGNRDDESWIILHGGWGAEHSYLLDAFKGLENGRHLVFYDQRGSLRSPCKEDSISVQTHVDDLERLREALGVDRVNIVAHSMGGFLAARYLQQHPDRVGRLLLMAPTRLKRPLDDDEEAISVTMDEAVKRLQQREEVEKVARAHGLWVDDPRSLGKREQVLHWRLNFASVNIYRMDRWHLLRGGGIYYDQSAAMAAGQTMGDELPFDLTGLLREHDYPVALLVGERDYVDWDARLNRHWFAEDEHVELIVFKEAGHNLWLDQPAEVHSTLRRLMQR